MSHRVIATAGHVDHGKSTLLRALTGMEPDRLDEERRRGLTLDLGFVWTDLPAPDGGQDPTTIAFVDVPGHERFVATMLAGAGAAPTALPVIAADDGWSQQSSEHRDVLDLLEVPAVAVVITKADLVDDTRLQAVVVEVAERLAGTRLAEAPVVITDAVTGRGLEQLRTVLRTRLDRLPVPADLGRPRLWVDRAFAVPGVGTVVTGTLGGGTLHRGDEVRLLPRDAASRIRGLHALGDAVDRATPGTRVAINLVGVDHAEVARGDAVVSGGPWRSTTEADLWVRVLEGRTLARSGAWHLHVGSARTTCRVLPLTGAIEGPDAGAVRVLLDHPLPLVAGDRVVLRDAGPRLTVAGGVVADPAPRWRPRGRADRAERADALREVATASPAARVGALARLAGGSRATAALLSSAGWPDGAELPDDVVRVGGHIATREARDRWRTAARSLGPGTHERAAVAAAVRTAGADEDVAREVADHLVDEGTLVRAPGGYALPEHVDAAGAARRARAAALVAALDAEPFTPPDLDTTARTAGLDHRELSAVVQSGEVVRCGKVAFTRTAVRRAVERLRELEARVGPFTAAQAKEAWGTTRRYAIPLLEHLDRTGVTRFDGQHRRLTGSG